MKYNLKCLILLLSMLPGVLTFGQQLESIDRHALVTRHNVVLTEIDTLGALSVGNGEFAFTADVTGLQTFPDLYENGIPLGTQSQWGWHSFPNPKGYEMDDAAKKFRTPRRGKKPYAIQWKRGKRQAAANWLRSNPHRLHLGLIGLEMVKENGAVVQPEDLQNIRQELNLWTGVLTSTFEVEGEQVRVETVAHQEQDGIAFRIESSLLSSKRLKIRLRFPYGANCHVCPGYDWQQPEQHTTSVATETSNSAVLQRKLDADAYFVELNWGTSAQLVERAPHQLELLPGGGTDTFTGSVFFSTAMPTEQGTTFADTQQSSQNGWENFWQSGGAIDFSECTDPRAQELERRVVLSQYLTKIQCTGSLPPQETGLTMNSWYGKFHLEMHWWHGVHFALWNRTNLLDKSLGWYESVLEEARETAEWQGYEGVRWQKMTAPEGRKSPSSVGEFLVWQQPHPIYFAELLYRENPEQAVLEKYQQIVFETAEFMADFATYNPKDGHYHLYHPLIPAQEVFEFDKTDDPAFELAYWHYGLSVAQAWRERLGMSPNAQWQEVLDKLAPLKVVDGLYLPVASIEEAYSDEEYRHDHPIVTGTFGLLPAYPNLDTAIMANTLEEILRDWDWESTWGWDYPMVAMCAARLGKGEAAVDALLLDVQKNTYLVNGHNYQNERLRLYLPGNGGLLTAVAMMAAGWDGAPNVANPGFPQNGRWKVRWENLEKMP